MIPPEVKRYRFGAIFDHSISGQWIPRFDLRINGFFYRKGLPIPPGPSFGGIDLTKVADKPIAGIWDNTTKELNIYGFYNI